MMSGTEIETETGTGKEIEEGTIQKTTLTIDLLLPLRLQFLLDWLLRHQCRLQAHLFCMFLFFFLLVLSH